MTDNMTAQADLLSKMDKDIKRAQIRLKLMKNEQEGEGFKTSNFVTFKGTNDQCKKVVRLEGDAKPAGTEQPPLFDRKLDFHNYIPPYRRRMDQQTRK
mmetsp:Transcript_13751/g.16660  ORF Transcript_13751/g.16660 Transcript_13751/m.16660 type:complete len:98 (+) Transcript_13751:99-392(+)